MKYDTKDYWELHRILNTWERDSIIDFLLDIIPEKIGRGLINQHKK